MIARGSRARSTSTPVGRRAWPKSGRQHKFRAWSIMAGWGTRCFIRKNDNIMCPLRCSSLRLHVNLDGGGEIRCPCRVPDAPRLSRRRRFDNFWKLVRTLEKSPLSSPYHGDLARCSGRSMRTSLGKTALFGPAPFARELFRRFEKLQAYALIRKASGLTEATCLVSFEPTDGPGKVGQYRHHFPYTDVEDRQKHPARGLSG